MAEVNKPIMLYIEEHYLAFSSELYKFIFQKMDTQSELRTSAMEVVDSALSVEDVVASNNDLKDWLKEITDSSVDDLSADVDSAETNLGKLSSDLIEFSTSITENNFEDGITDITNQVDELKTLIDGYSDEVSDNDDSELVSKIDTVKSNFASTKNGIDNAINSLNGIEGNQQDNNGMISRIEDFKANLNFSDWSYTAGNYIQPIIDRCDDMIEMLNRTMNENEMDEFEVLVTQFKSSADASLSWFADWNKR